MATKKKPTNHASTKKSTKNSKMMRSFHIEPEPIPFYSLRITRQTFYWIVLVLIIAASQLWILKLQLEIARLTDLLMATQ